MKDLKKSCVFFFFCENSILNQRTGKEECQIKSVENESLDKKICI